MPPFSGKVADSSAATNAVGIRNIAAANIKKKITELPKRAEEGRFRMLSMVAMMMIIKERSGIFFDMAEILH